MRGVELVIGGLLMASGLFSPLGTSGYETDLQLGPVEGNTWFEEVNYTGTGTINASEAALLVEGPVQANLTAASILVTVYEYTYADLMIEEPMRIGGIQPGVYQESVYRFDDVDLELSGQTDALMQLWTTESADLELTTQSIKNSSIKASGKTTFMNSRSGEESFLLEAPVFGLFHGVQGMDQFNFPALDLGNAWFDRATAEGGLMMIVENGHLAINHSGGHDEFQFFTESLTPHVISNVGAGEQAYGAVEIIAGHLEFDFDEAKSAFIAHDPTLRVNGTTEIQAENGSLVGNNRTKAVNNQTVKVSGNTTLKMLAEGEPDGSQEIGIANVAGQPALGEVEDPEAHTDLHTDDGNVTIDGQLFASATQGASSGPIPKEATLIATILGGLLAIWGVAKLLLVFIGGMVAKSPLKNPKRREIFQHLQTLGMAHVRELQRATEIPLGTLTYHLKILKEGKLVLSVPRSGFLVYYIPSPGLCRDEVQRLALLADPTRRNICKELNQPQPLSQTDLMDRLDLSRGQVSRQIGELVNAGLVARHGTRNGQYTLTDLVRKWLDNPHIPADPVGMGQECGRGGADGAEAGSC